MLHMFTVADIVAAANHAWSAIFLTFVVGFSEFKLLLDRSEFGKHAVRLVQAGVHWWYGIRKDPELAEWCVYLLPDGTETGAAAAAAAEALKMQKHADGNCEIRLVRGGEPQAAPKKRCPARLFQIFYFAPGKEPVALDVPRTHWVEGNDLLSREYVRRILQNTHGSAAPFVEDYVLRAVDLHMKFHEIAPCEYIHLGEAGAWTKKSRASAAAE